MRGGGPGQDSRVRLPSLGGHEVPAARCSVFALTSDVFAGRGADPASGAGRLMAGSDMSPELANLLALCLPASKLGRRWGALAPLAGVVLPVPAGTTGFLRRDNAILSSLRMAGESCIVEIALKRLNPPALA